MSANTDLPIRRAEILLAEGEFFSLEPDWLAPGDSCGRSSNLPTEVGGRPLVFLEGEAAPAPGNLALRSQGRLAVIK